MLKTIEASEVRTHLSEIMMEAYKNSTRFVLESDKTPMAVVIGYQDYLQFLEDKEDIEAMLEAAAAPESEKIDYDEYRKRRAEKALRETVLAFGKAAQKRGLTEEQLEREIKDDLEEIRSEIYKEQYCVERSKQRQI